LHLNLCCDLEEVVKLSAAHSILRFRHSFVIRA
jgi:hypothetical protein